MRERSRRELARVKSRRASAKDLREARSRLKEIESELQQIDLLPETKKGEEREKRYARVLRLRALRDDFTEVYPVREVERPNSLLLALVMTVAAFLFCAAITGGGYAALTFINQKPDPVSTANNFWYSMQQQDYAAIHANYLAPALRAQRRRDLFVQEAQQADQDFGVVTNVVLVNKVVQQDKSALLTYSVTRAKNVTYTVKLGLTMYSGSWGVSSLGGATAPVEAGVPAPPPTATPNPSGG